MTFWTLLTWVNKTHSIYFLIPVHICTIAVEHLYMNIILIILKVTNRLSISPSTHVHVLFMQMLSCIHTSIHSSVYLSMHLCFQAIHATIHLSIHPSIHASMLPCIHPSIYSSIHPSMHSCFHASIHQSIHPSIHSSICSSILHQSIYPFTHVSIRLQKCTYIVSLSTTDLSIYPNHQFKPVLLILECLLFQ